MLVGEARDAAQHWVATGGTRLPGFQGAYFTGSVNWQSDDTPLAAGSDVDIMVIADNADPALKLGKFVHQGALLEVSWLPPESVQTAEQILGDYHLAPNFATTTIIADPTGHLAALQRDVKRDYAKASEVRRRSAQARDRIITGWQKLDPGAPFHQQVTGLLFPAGITTHVLLVAGLRNPTVRKRYVAVHDLLAEHERLAVHEELLALAGYAEVPRVRVEQHLVALTEAFNVTAPLPKSPYQFASDISEVSRPIAIDGTWEMIRQGYHRESLFWIFATWGRVQTILAVDAPASAFDRFDTGYRSLAAEIGLISFPDLECRAADVVAYLPQLWDVAEAIISSTPEIERDESSF